MAASNSLLAQWATLQTPGIPALPTANRIFRRPRLAPRDGKPDFSGLYNRVSSYDRNVIKDRNAGQIQPWADALSKQRMEHFGKDNPSVLCEPEGPRYINSTGGSANGGMVRIVQNPGVIAFLHPDLTYRMIFMDGRKLEADPNPSWMGFGGPLGGRYAGRRKQRL